MCCWRCAFFLLCPKRPSPFSYVYPTKNPLSMIKYELSTFCRWCFLTSTVRAYISKRVEHWPTHEKFLSLLRHNLFMGVNKMCLKNITVTVSVTVSVTVRVSLGWFANSNSLVALSVAILWRQHSMCAHGQQQVTYNDRAHAHGQQHITCTNWLCVSTVSNTVQNNLVPKCLDTSAPFSWCRTVLMPKWLGAEVSGHRGAKFLPSAPGAENTSYATSGYQHQ